jgi:DnaJ-class molecular chaperone
LSGSCIVDAGEVISERDRCPQCKGNKISQEKKVLEVHVEKGMQQGQKIVFEGQADEAVSRNYYFFVLGHCGL